MKIVVTGGAGFIGSHAAEFFAKRGDDIIVFDNLSRANLLGLNGNFESNWNYLKGIDNIDLVRGDIRNFNEIDNASKGCDVIIHAAAQTAVTASHRDPKTDFEINALGTLNVLEAARKNRIKALLHCSTNKVYGENINKISINRKKLRYVYENKYKRGVPEDFPIDLCGHTPYGCSKLAADIYVQDYGEMYGIKTGVFRMSCIYGARQFGVEDQGWLAWMSIASLLNKPVIIYGDGRQVRDLLYVSDLIDLFHKFIKSGIKHAVLNVGGGPKSTLSILELIEMLEKICNRKIDKRFCNFRPNDQKVYISNISKAKKLLNWKPKIKSPVGIRKLIEWVSQNKGTLSVLYA